MAVESLQELVGASLRLGQESSDNHEADLLFILQQQCPDMQIAFSTLNATVSFLEEEKTRTHTGIVYALGALVGLSQDVLRGGSLIGDEEDEEASISALLIRVVNIAARFLSDSDEGVDFWSPAAALLCFLSSASDAAACLVPEPCLPLVVRLSTRVSSSLLTAAAAASPAASPAAPASSVAASLQCLQYAALALWYQTRVPGRAAALLSLGACEALRGCVEAAASVASAAVTSASALEVKRTANNEKFSGDDDDDDGPAAASAAAAAVVLGADEVLSAACSASLHILKPILQIVHASAAVDSASAGGTEGGGAVSSGGGGGGGSGSVSSWPDGCAGEAVATAAACIHARIHQHLLRFYPTTRNRKAKAEETEAEENGGEEEEEEEEAAKAVAALPQLQASLHLPLTLLQQASSSPPPPPPSSLGESGGRQAGEGADADADVGSGLVSRTERHRRSLRFLCFGGGGGVRREEVAVGLASSALDRVLDLLRALDEPHCSSRSSSSSSINAMCSSCEGGRIEGGGSGEEEEEGGCLADLSMSSFRAWACEELVPSLVAALFRGAAVELDLRSQLLQLKRSMLSSSSSFETGRVAACPSLVPGAGLGLFVTSSEHPSSPPSLSLLPSSQPSSYSPSPPLSSSSSSSSSSSADDDGSLPAGSFVALYPGEWRAPGPKTDAWWRDLSPSNDSATYTTTFADGAMQDGSLEAVARAAAGIKIKAKLSFQQAGRSRVDLVGGLSDDGDDGDGDTGASTGLGGGEGSLEGFLHSCRSLGYVANHPPRGTLPNLVFYEVDSRWLDDDEDDSSAGGVGGGGSAARELQPIEGKPPLRFEPPPLPPTAAEAGGGAGPQPPPNEEKPQLPKGARVCTSRGGSLLDMLPLKVVDQDQGLEHTKLVPERVMVLATLRRCLPGEELYVNYGAAASVPAFAAAAAPKNGVDTTGALLRPSSALPCWYHVPWAESRAKIPPWKIQGPPTSS